MKKNYFNNINDEEEEIIILSGGMPRSGSTWLFNVIRLLLQTIRQEPGKFECGWIDDLEISKNHPRRLIKLHEYRSDLVEKATFIAYSFRDIRDAIASAKRKFNRIPDLSYAKYLIEQDHQWRKASNYVMKYEDMIIDPRAEICKISILLGANYVDVDKILKELKDLDYDSKGVKNYIYNQENLFHKNHITNGKVGSWMEDLSADIANRMVMENFDWFLENNYPTEN